MNTKKRMEAENQFDKHRDIKLVTTDKKEIDQFQNEVITQ